MASKTLGPVHHKPMYRHYLATAFTLMYIGLQCFLPYSHFVTKVRLYLFAECFLAVLVFLGKHWLSSVEQCRHVVI